MESPRKLDRLIAPKKYAFVPNPAAFPSVSKSMLADGTGAYYTDNSDSSAACSGQADPMWRKYLSGGAAVETATG